VSWSDKTVGQLLATYNAECAEFVRLYDEEVIARRRKAMASFVPKVEARLRAARVKEPRVAACGDELLEWLMEDTQWNLRCGAIVQDALIIGKHNGRYAIFERGTSANGWDKTGMVLQDHHYPMTALTLSALDDAINVAARYLARNKLASRSR